MYFPIIGPMPWKCWCGYGLIVSGDQENDSGWLQVREHRAEHKKERRAA